MGVYSHFPTFQESNLHQPHFPDPLDMVYTVQAGTTAFLECQVEGLNNRSVSWVRKRDRHILAVDWEVSAKNKLSKLIDLVVVVPSVVIMPMGDRHVRMGSTVVMECVVDQVMHRPHHVAWIRNGKVMIQKQNLSYWDYFFT